MTAVLEPPAPVIAEREPKVQGPRLEDPLLEMAAAVLDDLESVRIGNENRLRQLTRGIDEVDADGGLRGFGLTTEHPDVKRLAELVAALVSAENSARLNLERRMRAHPLGPWVKQARGVGDKQAARLLAAIGDPAWNRSQDRPSLVSELWSFAGFGDAATQVRRRGSKVTWSPDARKRTWLVAQSIVKAGGPYREVYDRARERYAEAVHAGPCVRCGPSGKPAPAGSALSDGHKHARGLRAVAKAVLKDLWIEARRLHGA